MYSSYKLVRKDVHKLINQEMKNKMIRVCDQKIASKGIDVGLSFYAFFANKNDTPEVLLEVAHWWIQTNRLDHFEKASKIKKLIKSQL